MRKPAQSVGAIVVFALLVIGILSVAKNNMISLLLPVVIIGGIFLLYKYPPSFMGGKRSSGRQARSYQHKPRQSGKDRSRSKPMPFKVIEGGKDDNDDTPKYH